MDNISTKVMVFIAKRPIHINGKLVKDVSRFDYLGYEISLSLDCGCLLYTSRCV